MLPQVKTNNCKVRRRNLIVRNGMIVDHAARVAAEHAKRQVLLRWTCNARTHVSYAELDQPAPLSAYDAESVRLFVEATNP